jgi:hypothetical protein
MHNALRNIQLWNIQGLKNKRGTIIKNLKLKLDIITLTETKKGHWKRFVDFWIIQFYNGMSKENRTTKKRLSIILKSKLRRNVAD